ncbi:MAG: thioredoxin [Thermoplasmatota archaeon]
MGSNNSILTVTDEEFDDLISKNENVIVDLWATWCAPCKAVEPVIEDLAEKYDGKIVFAKVNIEENNKTPSQYGIQAIPAFLFFRNGDVVDQVKGAVPASVFEEKIHTNYEI